MAATDLSTSEWVDKCVVAARAVDLTPEDLHTATSVYMAVRTQLERDGLIH